MNIEYDERKFKELLLYVLIGSQAIGPAVLPNSTRCSSSPTSPMSDERAQRSRVPNTRSCLKVLRPDACFQFANNSSAITVADTRTCRFTQEQDRKSVV